MKKLFQTIFIFMLLIHFNNGFSQSFSKCDAYLKIDSLVLKKSIFIDLIPKFSLQSINVVLKSGKQKHACYSFSILYQKGNNNLRSHQPYSQTITNKKIEDGLKFEFMNIENGDIIYIDNIMVDINNPKKIPGFILKVENNMLVVSSCK